MNRPKTLAMVIASWLALVAAAPAAILTFQHGDGGAHSNTEATFVKFRYQDRGFPNQPSYSDVNYSTWISLELQHLVNTRRDQNKGLFRSLVQFTDFLGAGAGQVPLGATIVSATLRMTMYDNSTRVSQSAGTFLAHQMIKPWEEQTVTWDILSVSPGDYEPEVLDSVVTTGAPIVWDITSAVQSWSNGDGNHGIGLIMDLTDPDHGDKARFYSEDVGIVSWRPRLTVQFEAQSASVPEPSALLTWSGLLVLGIIAVRSKVVRGYQPGRDGRVMVSPRS